MSLLRRFWYNSISGTNSSAQKNCAYVEGPHSVSKFRGQAAAILQNACVRDLLFLLSRTTPALDVL